MNQPVVNVIKHFSRSELFDYLQNYGRCVNFKSYSAQKTITMGNIFVGSISEVGNRIVKKQKKHIRHFLVLSATNLVGTEVQDTYPVRIVFIGKVVQCLVRVNIKENDVIAVLNPKVSYGELPKLKIPSFTVGPHNVVLWLCRQLKVEMDRGTLTDDITESDISELQSESVHSESSTKDNADYRLKPAILKEVDNIAPFSFKPQDTPSVFIFQQTENNLKMKPFQDQQITNSKTKNSQPPESQSSSDVFQLERKKKITSNSTKSSHPSTVSTVVQVGPQQINRTNTQLNHPQATHNNSVTKKKTIKIKNNKLQKIGKRTCNSKKPLSQNAALFGSSEGLEERPHLVMSNETDNSPRKNLNSEEKSKKSSSNVGSTSPKKSIPNNTSHHHCCLSYQTNCFQRSCSCQHFLSCNCVSESFCCLRQVQMKHGNACNSCSHGCLSLQHNPHCSCHSPRHNTSCTQHRSGNCSYNTTPRNDLTSPCKSCSHSSCPHMKSCCISPHNRVCSPHKSCCQNLKPYCPPMRCSCCTALHNCCCNGNCIRTMRSKECHQQPIPSTSHDVERINRTTNWIVQHGSLNTQPATSIHSSPSSELSSHTLERDTYKKVDSNKSKEKDKNVVPLEVEPIKKKRKIFNHLESIILAEETPTSVVEESTPFCSEQSNELLIKGRFVPVDVASKYKGKTVKNNLILFMDTLEQRDNQIIHRDKDSELTKVRESIVECDKMEHTQENLEGQKLINSKLRSEAEEPAKTSGTTSSSSTQPNVRGLNKDPILNELQGNDSSNVNNPDPLLSEEIELLSETALKKRKKKSSVSPDARSTGSSSSNETIDLGVKS